MFNQTLTNYLPSAVGPSLITDSAAGQVLTSYNAPNREQFEDELAQRLSSQGNVDRFSSLSKNIGLRTVNNAISAVDNATNQVLGRIEDSPLNDTAANDLPAYGQPTDSYKVTITAQPILGGLSGDTVIFDIMPSISESQNAQYDAVDIVHHPGAILKYKNTSAREWGITADLVSRTVDEADANLKRLCLLRSWLLPFYGVGTGNESGYSDKLGAPPQILTFSGFGPRMIGQSSVVMTNFSWAFEPDIDYIYTSGNDEPDGTRVPFPVHLRIQVSLSETWTPKQFTNFNLRLYREGSMPSAFTGAAYSINRQNAGTSNSLSNPGRIDSSQLQTITRTSSSFSSFSESRLQTATSTYLSSQSMTQSRQEIVTRLRSGGGG